MFNKEKLQYIGVVTKVNRVKEVLAIEPFRDFTAFTEYNPQYIIIELNKELIPFKVKSFNIVSAQKILIEPDYLIHSSKIFINSAIYSTEEIECDHSIISPDNDPQTLINCEVIELTHGHIGVIKGITKIKHNPLIEIESNGKEILIPLNGNFIVEFNYSKKRVILDLPIGLIDL
ncbi:hypothetical protein QA597_03755 [Marinilabiliaceae bacterium ANBcel2]|nr:hypothetical protein [Marinilabiliaceae bacterium ANBcel2]